MQNQLTQKALLTKLEEASVSLLEMAEVASWNKISSNCFYILSEIEYNDKSFGEQQATRKSQNDKKEPKPLKSLIPLLEEMYTSIYEIDLCLYKSKKNSTIIEIGYILKRILEPGYIETAANDSPVLHCKVAIPFYVSVKKEKFDINWESGSFQHKWKTFSARLKYKLDMAGRVFERFFKSNTN